MSEARRLLKLTQAILHGYACQQEDSCLEACELARAYLAQPSREGELVAALKWYENQARSMRLLDGGERARAVLGEKATRCNNADCEGSCSCRCLDCVESPL